MAALFQVPTRQEVSENNQAIFDQLKKGLGFVPNLYAYYAKSATALGDYLTLQNRKTSLRNKEKEVINLVTSQVNGCQYCLAAHTMLGKNAGFTEEQILDIRQGQASFDQKLNALAAFTKATVEQRGKTSAAQKTALLDAGYTEGNLVDIIVLIGDKTISNYIHNTTELPIDFPLAPALPTLSH
ncbi:MAG: carboxymuconolactone decarboxylase family protein [Aureispira sp.]